MRVYYYYIIIIMTDSEYRPVAHVSFVRSVGRVLFPSLFTFFVCYFCCCSCDGYICVCCAVATKCSELIRREDVYIFVCVCQVVIFILLRVLAASVSEGERNTLSI